MSLELISESDNSSRDRLLKQGQIEAEFPALLSPSAHRDVAAHCKVHLVIDIPRDAYHVGPWPIGRPRADYPCCVQAAILDWHMTVAKLAQIRVFVEILYDQDYPNVSAGGCRVDPCAVRAYRYHFAYGDNEWVVACTKMSELLAGPDPHKCKRYLNGRHKMVVPGKYDTTASRLYSEKEYVKAVRTITAGMWHGFDANGVTYDTAATGEGADMFDLDDEDQGEIQTGGAVLPEHHVAAPFEFARVMRHALRDQIDTQWNLAPEQRGGDCYYTVANALRFPFPRLVVEIDYSSADNSPDYRKYVGYEYYPDVAMLRSKLRQQGRTMGANLSFSLSRMTMDELIDRMRPSASARITDPTVFDPIKVPAHWSNPGLSMAGSQSGIVMTKTFPVVEMYKRHMRRVIKNSYENELICPQTEALRLMELLWHTPPDHGVPIAFHDVFQSKMALIDDIDRDSELGRHVDIRLFDKGSMNKHTGGHRMSFGSISTMRDAVMFTSDLRLTQVQAMAFELIHAMCAGLGKHDSEQKVGETAQAFIFVAGNIALGKTVLTEVLIACIVECVLELAGTESEMADCENMCNKLIIKDDINLANKSTEKYQSELSTGVRTHKRNRQREDSGDREIEKNLYARDGNVHVATSNTPLNAAMHSRAINVDIPDDADAAAKKSANSMSKRDLMCEVDVDPMALPAAGTCMRLQNLWTWDMWKSRNIGLYTFDTSLWKVVLTVMRHIIGEEYCLDIRKLMQAKRLAVCRMLKRVSSTWQCVIKPYIERNANDDTDIDATELLFYRHYSIMSVSDAVSAIRVVENTCSDEGPLRQVACALRMQVRFERGNMCPITVDGDSQYFETDLPPIISEMAARIGPILTSMKRPEMIGKYINKLMQDNRGNNPVIKIVNLPNKPKCVVLLKSYFCSTTIVSQIERDVYKALMNVWQFYKTNRNHEDDEFRANVRAMVAIEYEEPDDPYVVFQAQVKTAICNPCAKTWFPADELLVDIMEYATVDLTKTVAIMGYRPDVLVHKPDEPMAPAEIEVAHQITSADVSFIPENAEPCRRDGLIVEDYPGDTQVYKTPKQWVNGIAVRMETMYHFHHEATVGVEGTTDKWMTFATAVHAIEGVVRPNERVAVGIGSLPDVNTGHPCSTFEFPGVPEDWTLKIQNKRTKWSAGDESQMGQDNRLFSMGSHTTFTKYSNLWDRVARAHSRKVDPKCDGPPEWASREFADYAWKEL